LRIWIVDLVEGLGEEDVVVVYADAPVVAEVSEMGDLPRFVLGGRGCYFSTKIGCISI